MFVQHKQRGFSLVELMIVMVIAAVVIGSGFAYLNSESKRLARENAVADGAREIAIISRAVNEFLDSSAETSGLPKDGSPSLLDPAVHLAGLLPENFGAKPPLTGIRNPVGQPYSIWVAKHNGVWKGVITTDGSADVGVAAAANVESTAQAVAAFNRAVMAKSSRSFQSPVGMTIPNAKAVAPMGEKLATLSLGTWFDSAAIPKFATASVAAMVNYAELSTSIPADPGSGAGGGGNNPSLGSGLPINKGCILTKDTECPSGYSENWSYRLCDNWGFDKESTPSIEYVNSAVGQVTLKRFTSGKINGQGGSNRYAIPYSEFSNSFFLAWPKVEVPPSKWTQVSQAPGSMSTNGYCGATYYSQISYQIWNIRCPATGETSTDYYWSTCGTWLNNKVGNNCVSPYWAPYAASEFNAGITSSMRIYPMLATNVKAPNQNVQIGNSRMTDPVVRTIGQCPGSVNTLPIDIKRKTADSGYYEYMDLYDGTYTESLSVGVSSFSATCETVGVLATSSVTVGDTVITNACPSLNDPAMTGVRKGLEHYRVPIKESAKPMIRVCCQN